MTDGGERLFWRGLGLGSNRLKSRQGNRDIVYMSVEDRGIPDIVGGQNQKGIQERQPPACVSEEQEHTCELLVIRAVGTCVFSQSHDKIFIPGVRQVEVHEGKQSGQNSLCLTYISPPTHTSVQGQERSTSDYCVPLPHPFIWDSELRLIPHGPLPSHTKESGAD